MINRTDYSLREHNTFGIEARAARFIEYVSLSELLEALSYIRKHCARLPLLHIGAGSNLLFLNDFSGVILHSCIEGIDEVECTSDQVILRVGAGVVWDDLVAYTVEHNLAGLENLSDIPGEVGASAIQNIGAYGVEAKDFITMVETVDIATSQIHVFENKDCEYAYRSSIFKHQLKGKHVVTHVRFCLSRIFTPQLEYGNIGSQLMRMGVEELPSLSQMREAIITIRNEKLPDPKKYGNAGSFFMNPILDRHRFEQLLVQHPTIPHFDLGDMGVKIPAGWLIEQCGWKGYIDGRVGVYSQQALVLINYGGALGQEIAELSKAICADVEQRFGIKIVPEVNFIA